MTLHKSELESYDAQPLLDTANGFKRLGPQIENLFQRYVTIVTAPDWQGVAAEAAHTRAVRDRKTAYSMADILEESASRLEQGYWDVSTPLKTAQQSIASAEAAGFSVSQLLFVSHPPGSDPTPESESARAEWERRILTAAHAVATEDQRLQQDLSTLGESMQGWYEAIGRSETTDEKRFMDAERYIFEEIKRNIDSDTVKTIRSLLEPEWWERGFSGVEVAAALALWAWKVAPAEKFPGEDAIGIGDWDHKPKLRDRFGLEHDFYFQQPGTDRQVFYDIYSNVHYGFVGRAAGFESDTLLEGGTAAVAGRTDEADRIMMRAGIELYDKYGPDITEEQFHRGLIAAIDKMEVAKSEGKEVIQIKHEN
ncbi:polymorphic toxin type 44 domain-containing protein [Nocardia nepalensis]|uniref:polymorphic toxin type 44 domain-containing protein n=1 Tax=Nocardia nepalensis TaxID=3375448 RepID=UPI003B678BA0